MNQYSLKLFLLIISFFLIGISSYSQLNDCYYTDRNFELYNPALSTNGRILISGYNKHKTKQSYPYNASAFILGISTDSSNFTGILTYMGSYFPNLSKIFSFNGGLSYKYKNLSFGANAGIIYGKAIFYQNIIDPSDPTNPDNVSDMTLDINAGLQYSSYLDKNKINHLKVHISYNHLNSPTLSSNTTLVGPTTLKPLLKSGVSFRHLVISDVLDVRFSYNGFYSNNYMHLFSFTDIYKEVLELGAGISTDGDTFFRLGLNLSHLHIRLVYFSNLGIASMNALRTGRGFEENILIYTGSDYLLD